MGQQGQQRWPIACVQRTKVVDASLSLGIDSLVGALDGLRRCLLTGTW
jgi:hypothetical protein